MYRRNNNFYLSVILIAVLLFSFMTIYAASSTKASRRSLGISAKSAVLYEPESGVFLYEKNASERLPMASTTKIMTALVAIEHSDPSELVAIDDSAIGIEGSSAYLRKGDVLTMEELLYALMLGSANDAAVAIACHIGNGISGFSDMMNEKAAELGLSDTHFSNPHGLDDEEHYTTAHDLSLIAAAALKNETFKTISSTYKKSFVTDERSRTYVNHNKLLSMYDGSIGMKTGFTKKSGRCLVGAAEREGLTFITVTLNAPNDWQDHTEMLNLGFDTLEKITFAEANTHKYEVKVLDGVSESVSVTNTDSSSVIVKKGEHSTEAHVKLSRFVTAPIRSGDILGEVIYTLDGEIAGSVKLVAMETVDKKEEKGLFKKIFSIFRN